ncbi:MAG: bifunctional riboflavin kinase/FAD synthetase [Deltaproteobacteria bacterium]|nr:bifunctional riboflavin kinase/FAD synthetase [Deltaproteobacteria bacterium]
MKIHTAYRDISTDSITSGTVVTIGNFDGVHLGHQTIFKNCTSISKSRSLGFLICTFEPHPAELFAKDKAPVRLTLPRRKQALLTDMSPDILLIQDFTREFAAMPPERFVTDALVKAMNARVIVLGKNFRFGKDRAGDIAFLERAGKTHGFEVIAEDLLSTPNEVISSTRIRTHISKGEVALANTLLGRHHELPGTVVRGKQMGARMGFPTLNIAPENVMVPGDGIYAAFVDVGADRQLPAAVYIGNRPTLNHGFSIEAHLFNFNREAYNQPAVIHFVDHIRPNRKFETVERLQQQIAKDIEAIRQKLENRS